MATTLSDDDFWLCCCAARLRELDARAAGGLLPCDGYESAARGLAADPAYRELPGTLATESFVGVCAASAE